MSSCTGTLARSTREGWPNLPSLRTQHPSALDRPHFWNAYLKPWLDLERWQEDIDARIGLNREGRSIVRLVWGQDIRIRTWGAEMPRYWLRRQRQPSGQYTYWTVPRWVFEKRLERSVYEDSWNATRYSTTDATQGSPKCGDCGCTAQPVRIADRIYCSRCSSTNITGGAVVDKGPPPEEYFTYLMDCSVHESVDPTTGWAHCCTRAFYAESKFGSAGSRCWGEYRPPGGLDLQVIDRLAQQLQSEKFIDPYRPLSPAELAETELAANKQVERAAEQFAAWETELYADYMRLHGWRLTGEPAPGFHDVGASSAKVAKESVCP